MVIDFSPDPVPPKHPVLLGVMLQSGQSITKFMFNNTFDLTADSAENSRATRWLNQFLGSSVVGSGTGTWVGYKIPKNQLASSAPSPSVLTFQTTIAFNAVSSVSSFPNFQAIPMVFAAWPGDDVQSLQGGKYVLFFSVIRP